MNGKKKLKVNVVKEKPSFPKWLLWILPRNLKTELEKVKDKPLTETSVAIVIFMTFIIILDSLITVFGLYGITFFFVAIVVFLHGVYREIYEEEKK